MGMIGMPQNLWESHGNGSQICGVPAGMEPNVARLMQRWKKSHMTGFLQK